MATTKPRFTITLEKDLYERVNSFKDRNGISTQSKAIQQLIEIGVQDILGDKPTEKVAYSPSDADLKIVRDFNSLDAHGKRIVRLVLDAELDRCRAVVDIAKDKPATKIIPLFGTPFAAGPGEPDNGEPFEDYEVPADSPAEFAVRITGDSMEPELHDGEIALCTKRRPKIGEIVVALVNGSFYVKQFISDGSNIYLRSVNRARKDSDLDIWASGDYTGKCFGTVIHRRIPLVEQ